MKRMLFESLPDGDMQVSIEEAGIRTSLISLESINEGAKNTSNIYMGVISRIEPSLNACFINYGEDHHGFLPFQEVASSYFLKGTKLRNTQIDDALKVGQELIVQVQQPDGIEQGVSLTTFVTLPGRYLLLLPRHDEGKQAQAPDLHQQALQKRLALSSDMPFTVRDSGFNCSIDEAQYDLGYLRQLWSAIKGTAGSVPAPFLIYQDDSIVIQAIRDHFQQDIEEIIVDRMDIYEQLTQYMQHVMPTMAHRVKHANARQSRNDAVVQEVSGQPSKTLLARLRNLFAR